ncbi:FtsX-like permease family protein [Ligilactobacillus pobuzihii]|uniref:ABC transporter permease n=1 Tax=Ligilactobacillus pobuzihii TaxID=449659 RepID=UPI0019D04F34|nr:ABC transporter permease [Ligilactobacillus pobuzihii]MBN7274224.1 FtsX-like permease family protein [Ligilactobacillus pobuzihii]
MIFWELIKTAWQSLKTNPKRSILTMIGIIIGIGSVITIMALGNGIKKKTLDQFQLTANGNQTAEIDFYQNDGVSLADQGFNDTDIGLIKNQFSKTVQNVKIDQSEFGITMYGSLGNNDRSLSIGLTKGNSNKYHIVNGQNINYSNNQTTAPVALISQNMAQKEYGHAANALGTSLNAGEQTYRVIGTFDHPKQDYADYEVNVILPQKTFKVSNGSHSGDTLKITYKKGTDVRKQSKKIVKFLKKRGLSRHSGSYEAIDMGKALKQISSVINALTYFISAIAAISLFIAGIGVMNMMYISVSERTQEIGIRLAVGAKPSNIMLQFLLEAVMLTLSGGLLGFVFGWGLASLISLALPFNASVSLGSFLLAAGVSSGVGIVFGILPARQAAQKNLIDTLR